MKALTLTQPWATLVALGEKKIETRSWGTGYRGELLIHAAKGQSLEESRVRNLPVFEAALRKHGLEVTPLPMGALVGRVQLVQCGAVDHPGFADASSSWDRREWEFGNLEPGAGRYAWVLAEAEYFWQPKPMKGAQGLWEAKL